MVLGGGGSPTPKAEIIVQLGFVAAVLAWTWWAGRSTSVPRPLLFFGAALVALPLIQLLPLPPVIWQALPGRELQLANLALVGAEDSWRPLSISPSLTLAGLLALIPAVGTMWAVSTLGHRDRRFLLLTIGLIALAGAGLGALQLAGGLEAFRLYEKSHRGWLTAFHANRNAAVDVLLIGSLAFAAWHASDRKRAQDRRRAPLVLAALVVLLFAILMTGSRAGIALLLVAIGFGWLILFRTEVGRRTKQLLYGFTAIALGLLAIPFLLGSNPQLARVAERFDATGDARFPLWQDTVTAIQSFGWAGSGIGTFTEAFLPHESMEYLGPASPNRAHNDYLEFLLEAGMLAPLLIVLGAVVLFLMAQRAWKLSPHDNVLQLFAMGGLAIVALHSIVDYPLRNMAIACLAAAMAGLLTPSAGGSKGRKGRDG
ncbi:O-antigen ligase family protein [Qipengyuania aquimaris]|uniref:O-antigen ligase family protein n=1 Tax=Qipengyuania aquimaris TaxID=255984 RepID=A0A9Q3XCV6_9SPHN|nr:O-antigen ligase family protein [Qipengyuania aquimaris]MBY6217151.1 O-antigen ligase family protein [Qipengyuania aquimaris]